MIDNLEKITSVKIDGTKPIIIIYHPGKDPCNTSGSATAETMKVWFDELEKGTERIAKVKPIYIAKNLKDLEERDKVLNWYEDTGRIIENLFFSYHYPCSSYVIIAESGKYHAIFGEFGKESVWKNLRRMK